MKKHRKLSLMVLAVVFLTAAAILNFVPSSGKQNEANDLPQKQTAENNNQDIPASTPTPAVLTDSGPSDAPLPAPAQKQQQAAALPGSSPNGEVITGNLADPVTLKIASIKLMAPIIKTGLETDGSLHVPSSPDLTGWYSLGPKPGETGPAVITGHYDSAQGPGVLYNLKNVKPGDEISIIRNDGSVAVFSVTKSELYPQENFNTQAVYGNIDFAGLRIITCAGTYNKTTKHYSDDLVVYAALKQILQPSAYSPL